MKRWLLAIVASALLALAASAGSAWAGGLPAPTQATQSQTPENSIEQDATAKSAAVNLSPNISVVNLGSHCSCPGGLDQTSSADSTSTASNPNSDLKDPGKVGGSDAGRCPGGRRCSCDAKTEEVLRRAA